MTREDRQRRDEEMAAKLKLGKRRTRRAKSQEEPEVIECDLVGAPADNNWLLKWDKKS